MTLYLLGCPASSFLPTVVIGKAVRKWGPACSPREGVNQSLPVDTTYPGVITNLFSVSRLG